MMKVGVVGGGLMGLAIAYRLSQKGHTVTVFEQNQQLGGLTTYQNYGSFTWDRFYHVILPSDAHLIGFLNEIGLGHELQWKKTYTGYFIERKLYSISNTVEFFRFPLLGLVGKLRLAFTILYGSKINRWWRLEKIPVEKWLIRFSGKRTYETFWKPLLLAKLGDNYRRVSAVFIWSYIKRLFSARDSSLSKEQMGYVKGGYKTVFDQLTTLINAAGGVIQTGVSVQSVFPASSGGLWIETDDSKEQFDKVIFTGPTNVLEKIAAQNLIEISRNHNPVEYLGVVCMVLLTRKPLVPYYVVNIADPEIPFTGVIGMSSLVSLKETAGLYLTYLPKYVLSNDPWLRKTNQEIHQLFLKGLQLMFPNYDLDDIVSVEINRAVKVQPLQVIHYSSLVPTIVTANKDFLVLNTAQFVQDTLNNNTVIRHVDEFVKSYF
jgi:protoporphyrinogen oxidase